MFAKRISVALVAASLIVVPVERAQAGNHAAVLGGLLLGAIIANEVNKNKRRKTSRTTNSAAYSSQRAQNRQVQTALNYFGYNVGQVDGSIGRNTRNGIARYQSDMGFPADGTMDAYERDFLINSQQRAEVSYNVPPYNLIVATQGRGGLLRTFRNEQLGIAPVAQAPAPQQVPAVVQQQPQVPAIQRQAALPTPVPVPTPIPAQPQIQPTREAQALPQFTFNQSSRSVSTLCNQISVLTAANGGVTSAARVTDPAFTLSEQFCLARTHAIAEAAVIEATIPNMTPAQVEAQCKGLAQAVAPHITALGTSSPDSVISATSAFMQSSGQPVASLISGGKVCLGVGYRTDNAEMALASAVLLTSAGQRGYGEIVSHQMREGVGTARTAPQQSNLWMSLGLNGMVGANPPVLGQSAERVAVLSAAMATGGAATATLPVFPSSN